MALSQNEQKELVGKGAIDKLIEKGLIFSGMKIGLGTGSTAMWAVKRVGEKIADGTLKDIKAVSTSFQTTIACEELGIPVYDLNSSIINGELDLAIDGADEVDQNNNLIKGGGAALLNEKIVAYNSKVYVIITDESKVVKDLGTKFPLPVEIVPGARKGTVSRLEKLGASCTLREGVKKCGPVITDNGNQILDCLWQAKDGKSPVDPEKFESQLKLIIGVVEVGFFTQNKPIVFISHSDGSLEIRNSEKYF
ncbi:MAG: ribose-5-phosphate isomerase RpiA [Treponemataceae bacterium]|nr:ribose-5-phosphate isomerase RpiA [Treponemataceae bacterium]